MHVCMYVCICIYIYIYIHVCVCVCVCVCVSSTRLKQGHYLYGMSEGIHIINEFKVYKIRRIFENDLVGCRELLNRLSIVKFTHYVMD